MVTHYEFANTNSEDYVDTASDERIDVLRNDDWIWSGRDSGGKVIRQYRSSSVLNAKRALTHAIVVPALIAPGTDDCRRRTETSSGITPPGQLAPMMKPPEVRR